MEEVRSLHWVDEPTPIIFLYCHSVADTPFGEIRIEWMVCAGDPINFSSKTPWGSEDLSMVHSLTQAKVYMESLLDNKVLGCFVRSSGV